MQIDEFLLVECVLFVVSQVGGTLKLKTASSEAEGTALYKHPIRRLRQDQFRARHPEAAGAPARSCFLRYPRLRYTLQHPSPLPNFSMRHTTSGVKSSALLLLGERIHKLPAHPR